MALRLSWEILYVVKAQECELPFLLSLSLLRLTFYICNMGDKPWHGRRWNKEVLSMSLAGDKDSITSNWSLFPLFVPPIPSFLSSFLPPFFSPFFFPSLLLSVSSFFDFLYEAIPATPSSIQTLQLSFKPPLTGLTVFSPSNHLPYHN